MTWLIENAPFIFATLLALFFAVCFMVVLFQRDDANAQLRAVRFHTFHLSALPDDLRLKLIRGTLTAKKYPFLPED